MKRTRPPEVLVQAAQQWHAAGAEGCGASSASGPRPVCETGNMESAAPMIQSQRCFMIFPFESGELLICGPLPHYLKLLAASAQARNFFDLYAVIVIDGPCAHVRVSVVNRGVDRGAAGDVARPSSLCAPDHSVGDVLGAPGHP